MRAMKEALIPYTVGDQSFDLFVATPDGDGPHPLVLVCHAWGGRSSFDEDKARALAKLGYVGAAIDVYGVGVRGGDTETNSKLMSALLEKPEELRDRLRGAYDAAITARGVDGKRAGVIGFCFGGLCATLMARMGLELRGAVSFHGLLKVGERLDEKVRARLLILHGQDDPMVPSSDLGAFSDELARVHAEWQLHVYPNTMHAFTNPTANDPDFGTVYHGAVAERAWNEMRTFFEETL